MSEIRVLVNGAKGRMGSEAVQAVIGADGLELVGETDLGDELSSAIEGARAQVVVDFTIPSAAVHNANVILDSGASPVVGTTGFSVEEIEALQEKAAGLGRGGLIAPNFAIGAVLLMKFAQQAAQYFPDVEVKQPAASFKLLKSGAIKPQLSEISRNARSRSARLRIAERTDSPSWSCKIAGKQNYGWHDLGGQK